uniref:Uncharacterized protein n=1 Tax=Acartia pacifica TaxID=335913 RepID=A0A0U2T7E3_ACAPC|nr:hypothetical protein [Acartia pacifica]
MDQSYVVSGVRRNLKLQKKNFILPEVSIENEGVRLRSSSIIKHSTPNQDGLKTVHANSSLDSGYEDFSATDSSTVSVDSVVSDGSSFKIPESKECYGTPRYKQAKQEESLWESLISPFTELKQQFRSRPSFIDDRTKIKLDIETLITCCLLTVVGSSIVFSVYMGTSLVRPQSGKYRSISYGLAKRIESLKEEERLLDNIQDEYGAQLGGKRAAIQFAYDKKFGGQDQQKTESVTLKMETSEDKPNLKKPKVVAIEGSPQLEAAEDLPNIQDLSILELSRKIDELNSLLQNDLLSSPGSEVNLDETIRAMRSRRLQMIKDNVKPKASVRPAAPVQTVQPLQLDKSKPSKTKVVNPLTKSLPKQSKVKKIKKESVETKTVNEAEVEDYPGPENLDVDDGKLDYPDDPQFRSRIEV